MNSRAFTLSLVIAGIAVFMVNSYIGSRESDFKARYGDEKQVVVATEDILQMEVIDETKLQLINVPSSYVQPGAYNKIEDLFSTIAITGIKKGEQITKQRVEFPGQSTGLAHQIQEGKRAFAVQVSEDQAVAKLIKPGDRVDVISQIDYSGGQKDKVKVHTVLQDVLVLATGLKVSSEVPLVGYQVDKEVKKLNLKTYTNFQTITLELEPHEVQKLVFVIRNASGMYFSLRNNNDRIQEKIGSTRLYDVLGQEDVNEAKTFFLERNQRNERRR